MTADFKQENDEHILDRARQLAQEDERSAEAALVEQIVSFTGQGGKGVLGVDDTILALIEGRVDTIAVIDGLVQEGSHCHNCDYFAARKFEQCPACSSIDCEDVPDIIEHAIEYALIKGSRVNFVYLGAEEMLQSRGGIGALLRYPAGASA
jgi:peptide subunit release factor 1 (eRF1)